MPCMHTLAIFDNAISVVCIASQRCSKMNISITTLNHLHICKLTKLCMKLFWQ